MLNTSREPADTGENKVGDNRPAFRLNRNKEGTCSMAKQTEKLNLNLETDKVREIFLSYEKQISDEIKRVESVTGKPCSIRTFALNIAENPGHCEKLAKGLANQAIWLLAYSKRLNVTLTQCLKLQLPSMKYIQHVVRYAGNTWSHDNHDKLIATIAAYRDGDRDKPLSIDMPLFQDVFGNMKISFNDRLACEFAEKLSERELLEIGEKYYHVEMQARAEAEKQPKQKSA